MYLCNGQDGLDVSCAFVSARVNVFARRTGAPHLAVVSIARQRDAAVKPPRPDDAQVRAFSLRVVTPTSACMRMSALLLFGCTFKGRLKGAGRGWGFCWAGESF